MNLLIERLPQLLTLVEEWKPVVGYEESYEVSSTGKVRSLDRIDSLGHRRRGREMKLAKKRRGYFQVTLYQDGKRKYLLVHRLVVQAFRGEIPEDLVVRHITDDPDLNFLPFLEIGTSEDNASDKVNNGRCVMTNLHGSKTHCPRGHQLDGINLMPSQLKEGTRSCLACSRARALNQRRKLGLAFDSPEFKALADQYYANPETQSRTECSRGHDITSPLNQVPSKLRRGERKCLACDRARAHNRNRKLGLAGDSPELQDLSDEFYRATLAGFTSPERFYSAIAATVTT